MDMDPNDADLACIVQALEALPPPPSPSPTLVQALPATPTPSPTPVPSSSGSRTTRRAPEPPSPRRTRSGGAPEWTAAETLALVAEVAAVDDGWSRSVSAFQKWAIVAENLASSEAAAAAGGGSSRRRGRGRPASECRRRWEALAAEYGAVRRWEVRTGGRYWEMGAAARRKAGLPAEFDAEVYGVMDALIRVEEALLADAAGARRVGDEEVEGLVGAGGGAADEAGEEGGDGIREEDGGEVGEGKDKEEAGEEEDDKEAAVEGEQDDNNEGMLVDAANADASDDLEACDVETNNETKRSQNDAWELANKLHENAQHIHMILKEEDGEDAGQNHAGSTSPDAMVATRQKADELIKSLGGLVSYLNQFTDLIKENGFENVVGMS